MARISKADIERLNAEISLERLIETAGISLTDRGGDRIGTCPFHADRDQSLVVSPKENRWRCIGPCQGGGAVLDWVMRVNGISLRHAAEFLRADPVLAARAPVKLGTVRKLPLPIAANADDQSALNQVIGYYHEILKASPEALAYLKARALDHPELIDTFRLGFANRTLGLRLPAKTRKAGGGDSRVPGTDRHLPCLGP